MLSFRILLILSVVLSAAILGVLVWSSKPGDPPSVAVQTHPSLPSDELQKEEIRPLNVPAGWEIYRDETYGIAFAYPPNWNVCPTYLARGDDIYEPVVVLDPRIPGCAETSDWAGELVVINSSEMLWRQYSSIEALAEGFTKARLATTKRDWLPVQIEGGLEEKYTFDAGAAKIAGPMREVQVDGKRALEVITDAVSVDKTLIDVYVLGRGRYFIFEFPNREEMREAETAILPTIRLPN